MGDVDRKRPAAWAKDAQSFHVGDRFDSLQQVAKENRRLAALPL